MNGFLERLLKEVNDLTEEDVNRVAEKLGGIKKKSGEKGLCIVGGEFTKKVYTLLIITRERMVKIALEHAPLHEANSILGLDHNAKQCEEFIMESFALQRKEDALKSIFWGQAAGKIKNLNFFLALEIRKNWVVTQVPLENNNPDSFKISLN
jgi:hypothetical protein